MPNICSPYLEQNLSQESSLALGIGVWETSLHHILSPVSWLEALSLCFLQNTKWKLSETRITASLLWQECCRCDYTPEVFKHDSNRAVIESWLEIVSTIFGVKSFEIRFCKSFIFDWFSNLLKCQFYKWDFLIQMNYFDWSHIRFCNIISWHALIFRGEEEWSSTTFLQGKELFLNTYKHILQKEGWINGILTERRSTNP